MSFDTFNAIAGGITAHQSQRDPSHSSCGEPVQELRRTSRDEERPALVAGERDRGVVLHGPADV